MTDTDIRRHFHDELGELENDIVAMGSLAERMVAQAVDALLENDNEAAEAVVEQDLAVDDLHALVHQHWFTLVAKQSPVGSDLRLAVLVLHVNTSLERMGDQAVNIAQIQLATSDLPKAEPILQAIREMRDLVIPMIRTSLESLIQRDQEMARSLPRMDDPIDDLNRDMPRLVVDCAVEPQLLESAILMLLAARALERVGDQSVDIAEQVAFLLSGEKQDWN